MLNQRIQGLYGITPDKNLNIDIIENAIKKHHINILQYRRKAVDIEHKVEEAKKLLNSTDGTSGRSKSNSDIIFVEEVQQLTGYKKSTIYSKVCRFEIPVISKRRPLTFSRTDIIDWLKAGKPSVINQEANDYLSKT